MRIVHTCLRYPPATGGVETYVKDIVNRTQNLAAGRDVRVLTSKLRTHGPVAELNPDLLLDDPMNVQRLHHTATPFFAYPRLQALKYYIGHHQPDIIHGHSFWYQPADTAARYTRRHRIPFIFHPYFYEHGVRHKASWQLYKHTYGRATFAAADVVVVISPFEQKLIEQASLPVKRFVLIPPGVSYQKYSRVKQNPFKKRGIKGSVLLTVSRLSQGKGLSGIITILPDLIKQHPTVQLVIVGEDFGYKENLVSEVNKVGLINHVHFLNKLSDDEIIGAYQHANIFVHPSHYELFGIALAESLAASTPVVARRIAAIPFVVPDGQAGILFNDDHQLVKAINTLLTNHKQRHKLGRQGQLYIQQNFSWDSSIKKITDLYTELA